MLLALQLLTCLSSVLSTRVLFCSVSVPTPRFPWCKHRSVTSSFMHCIYNPTKKDFMDWQMASERETWNHLPAIKSHCMVEMKLDKCVQKLRRKILSGHNRRTGVGESLGKRVPSFYTSPSLVNLSGLSVGDQTLLHSQNQQDSTGGQERMAKGGASDTNLVDGAAPNMDTPVIEARKVRTMSEGEGGGGEDGRGGYVKSTNMTDFYYRKSKSNENLWKKNRDEDSKTV